MKSHLIERLPELAEFANFADIKYVIVETMEKVEKQLGRMDKMLDFLDAQLLPHCCDGMVNLLEDAFTAVHDQDDDIALRDMVILFYMQNIESIEMASFQILKMVAVKFKNSEINRLLFINFEEAKEDCALLLLIIAKYFAN